MKDNTTANKEYISEYKKSIRRQKIRAFTLVMPLMLFLVVFFVTPIGTMLYKSFYNPKVSNIAPKITAAIKLWQDIDKLPNEQMFKTAAYEIKKMQKQRLSGKLAEEVNRRVKQTGSLIKQTARKLKKTDLDKVENYTNLLIGFNKKWGKLDVWHGIKAAGEKYTISYYVNTLDYEQQPDSSIVKKPEHSRVYLPILKRTFVISFVVTFLTILLAYPLSYYLSLLPVKTANLLLIMVLLPFWTSLLVRTTSWIVLLQTGGVVNKTLEFIGIIDKPLNIIYNQFSTILAMTHILLPFMILPLYSVMKGIDPAYVRASKSLGANSFMSLVKVYFPLSVPGLNAGALLVFILAIGYYITPALLGGADGQMISNLIDTHMRSTLNWELAAALGSVLLILILVLYWVYDKFVGIANLKF